MSKSLWAVFVAVLFLVSCGEEPPKNEYALVINEVLSSNDGVNIDEEGQTEDWLELANTSEQALSLDGFFIADSSKQKIPLPNLTIPAKSVLLFWADDDDEDGELHLPFKLSASGDELYLYDKDGGEVDSLVIPALNTNQSFARFPSQTGTFTVCRYATPNKSNGTTCEPPEVRTIEDDIKFDSFDRALWPRSLPAPLAINEVAIFPSRFIELKNVSARPLFLANYQLIASPKSPDFTLTNNYLSLSGQLLEAGEIITVDVPDSFMSQVVERPFNEGVISLFDVDTLQIWDSVPFMHWPEGASLVRGLAAPYSFHFCLESTKGEENDCTALESRDVGDRVRGLYTPSDFANLAAGGGKANIESVKFVMDLNDNDAVYLLGAQRWPLHYTFVREILESKPELNRCEVDDNNEFNNGWYEFSVENYFSSTTRQYHLGTLSKHANAGMNNIEFTFGDEISPPQMKDAFYRVTQFTHSPYSWSLRPQDSSQVDKAKEIEGVLPIVSPKAPFKDIVFQGLAPGLAFGTLRYVATEDLESASLGGRVIVLTDDVPNDIDFVGGLITEAFQTPLAHVNILSQSRNTPNMALPGASQKEEFKALFGKLVKLEVSSGGYVLEEAIPQEAQDFWDSQVQQMPVLTPRLNEDVLGLVDLDNATFDDLPAIGAKAAQMAEIFNVDPVDSVCREGGDFDYPVGAFSIPMSHYLRHFQESGAQAYLSELMSDDMFSTDLNYKKIALASLRQMILEYPVNTELLALVESWIEPRYGDSRVRFRSSSNTEDLVDFNGAGLYDSLSGELGSTSRPIDVAIKTVWSSLWNLRAYDERVHANVDQSFVAMAVLVHAAFTNERANGVGVGRNILEPTRSDQFYFNSQAGEASVTNPAPSVVTEQLIYQWPTRTPTLRYQSNSSIITGPVISGGEVRALACALDAVQEHFRSILDPSGESRWFTMETEFKFLGEERQLLLKQARPYKFGRLDIPNDCREL